MNSTNDITVQLNVGQIQNEINTIVNASNGTITFMDVCALLEKMLVTNGVMAHTNVLPANISLQHWSLLTKMIGLLLSQSIRSNQSFLITEVYFVNPRFNIGIAICTEAE